MSQEPLIVFVCEHGAAKSVIAAAYFNRFMRQMGLDMRAIARGTNPDEALSPQAVSGLTEDGVPVPESAPQKLRQAELQAAQRVVTFCELPEEYQPSQSLERWEDTPPVGENYAAARDAIVERIRQMLNP